MKAFIDGDYTLYFDGEIFEVGHSLEYCQKWTAKSDRFTYARRLKC